MNIARLREGWSSLETRSQITLVGSVLGVLITLYFLYSYAGKTSYSTLATGLDPAQTANWEKTLSSAGISYKVGTGGTELDVPSGQVSDARIALASKGMLDSGQSAFQDFNKSSLGTTDFQQQVQYQQALQSEISSTIEQIQGVNSATVALVMPQDTLFADQSSKASASVLVNGGGTLDASTVAGIAHLVSSSVKGLDPQNVTITDETGALLWPNGSSGGGSGNASSKLQADNLYASQLTSQINALLASTLGPNKALAQVHADLNVDQTTLDKVSYAKKGVPLTTQTQSETLASKGGGSAQLPSGTSTNTTSTPSYAGTTSGTNGSSNYKNTTATTTFGVDKTIQHSVVAPGSVNKLDVALMVDQSVPAAQVASLQKSVSSLVGLNTKRGDTMAVTRLAFAKTATTSTKSGPLASIDPIGIAKDVGVGLLALIFLFSMRRALKRREGESSVPSPTWLRELEGGITVAQLEAGQAIPQLPAAVVERRNAVREQVEEIANNSPEAIAAQVAQWMKE
jgi:flagellar M-ring protein FliF